MVCCVLRGTPERQCAFIAAPMSARQVVIALGTNLVRPKLAFAIRAGHQMAAGCSESARCF